MPKPLAGTEVFLAACSSVAPVNGESVTIGVREIHPVQATSCAEVVIRQRHRRTIWRLGVVVEAPSALLHKVQSCDRTPAAVPNTRRAKTHVVRVATKEPFKRLVVVRRRHR